ncbi:MAG: hypothetical protein AAF727_14750 [Pseudomonadota bacterium]
MALRTISAALAAIALSTTFAQADTARLAAQQCAVKTHAPGNYNVSEGPGVPNVLPGQGGTASGAARINDCLADVYSVQYGAKRGSAAAAAATATPQSRAASLAECKRVRDRHIATGLAATVGVVAALGEPYTASVIGGVIGSTRGIRGVNNRYRACVAAATAPPIDPNAAVFVGCSRREGVMSRGTALCVAP